MPGPRLDRVATTVQPKWRNPGVNRARKDRLTLENRWWKQENATPAARIAAPRPMALSATTPVTQMLNDLSQGGAASSDQLLSVVFEHLKAIAQHRMAGERREHTLQATALVNEAYLRLVGDAAVSWRDRAHFYGAAAEAMRRILVDHARKRDSIKRGGAARRVPLSVCDLALLDDPGQILALDRALSRLQDQDADAAQVVRLRFFAGLTNEQVAAALGVSERTVKREWTFARATLYRLLLEESAGSDSD